jgi:hypothetical protein
LFLISRGFAGGRPESRIRIHGSDADFNLIVPAILIRNSISVPDTFREFAPDAVSVAWPGKFFELFWVIEI